ncbi:hypothetical protein PO124_04370 [Bacillus licheniformis]|nr:hypothetical protein [Bacillus licheniformis]
MPDQGSRLPVDSCSWSLRVSELHETVRRWNNSAVSHSLSSKGYTPSQLFFFDTETTGLGGGAGNAIFCSAMQGCMTTA